jgi:hypothetical protein
MIAKELKSHFLNMYLIALSDYDFDKKEIDEILKIGEKHGVSESEFEKIILNPEEINFEIPQNLKKKIEYLYDYARIIWADGVIQDNETKSLYNFCLKFGFENEIATELTDWLIIQAKKDLSHIEFSDEIDKLINKTT